MCYCDSFCSTLTINNTVEAWESNNYTLSTDDSSVAMYTTGITLAGTIDKTEFMKKFPNSTISPYRNLK